MAHIFGGIWDRFNRNALNDLSKNVEIQGKTIQDLVAEGQLTPTQYAQLISIVNGSIKSGHVDKSDLTSEFKDEIDGFSAKLAQSDNHLANLDQVKMDKDTTDLSVRQINKNKGLLDETYFTNEVKQQWAGNTPVNATPPLGGVTTNHLANQATTLQKVSTPTASLIVDGSVFGEDLSWEIGSLGITNGENVSASNRLRSVSYISVDKGFYVYLKDYSKYKFLVFKFNRNDHTFVSLTDYVEGGHYQSEDDFDIKIVIAKNDDSAITTEEISELVDGFVIGSKPIELKSLSKDVTEKFGKTVYSLSSGLSIGSLKIDIGTGDELDGSQNRVRTSFVEIETEGNFISISDGINYKYRVLEYDNDRKLTYAGEYVLDGSETFTDAPLIRIVMARKDDSDVEDVKEFEELISIKVSIKKRIESISTDLERKIGMIESTAMSGVYDSPNISPVPFPATDEDLYGLYDNLVTDFPYHVEKEQIGTDITGLPINQYTFAPFKIPEISSMYGSETAYYITGNVKSPKILITSGVHGNEKGSTQAVYNFFNQLCNNWDSNSLLEYLRSNVEFVVVPIVNPEGFGRTSRTNSNGVDLNRRFSEQLEQEQIVLKSFFDDNSDADYYIDAHNTWISLDTIDNLAEYILMAYVTDNELIKNIGSKTASKLLNKWLKEYPKVKEASDEYTQLHGKTYPIGYITPAVDTSLADYVEKTYNIKSMLLELQYHDVFDGGRGNTELIVNAGLEIVANTMIGLVRNVGNESVQHIL